MSKVRVTVVEEGEFDQVRKLLEERRQASCRKLGMRFVYRFMPQFEILNRRKCDRRRMLWLEIDHGEFDREGRQVREMREDVEI